MRQIVEFSTSVVEAVGYYVYLLRDPRDGEIFYVGKGVGNRVFCHVTDSLDEEIESNKLGRIREITNAGLQVDHQIVRHGLTEKESFEVEAALIDVLSLKGLTNMVHGHKAEDRGLMNISDVIARYDAPPADIKEPVVLIAVNRLFNRGMSAEMLYEVTRGKWVMSARREKAKFACAVFRGVIREVYKIDRWQRSSSEVSAEMEEHIADRKAKFSNLNRTRWEFVGDVSHELRHYVGKNTLHYQKKGSQNPIKYVNC